MYGINWNDRLNREEITIDDALWLSMPAPVNPPGTGFPETSLFDDEYKERREIAESWKSSGQLSYNTNPNKFSCHPFSSGRRLG